MEEEKEVEQVQDDTNKELQEENNAETEQQNDAKQEEQPNTVSEAQDVANKAEQNLEDKKDKLIKIIRLISDIIFVPFFAIIIISSIIMLSAKLNNQVPSIFGLSAVKVLSGSMEPDLSRDDVVIVKFVKDTSSLQVGDVIAFYAYKEPTSDEDLSNDVFGAGISDREYKIIGGAQNGKQRVAAEKASDVLIHKIDQIATPISKNDPNYGKLFFHTTGNVEGSVEMWIMEDYVVGIWDGETNTFVGNILQFIASPTGNILLIVVPSVIIIVLLGMSLLKEYQDYKKEKEENQKEVKFNENILKNIEDGKSVSEIEELAKEQKVKESTQEEKPKEEKKTEEKPKVSQKVSLPPKASVNLPPKNSTPPKASVNLPPKASVNLPPKSSMNLPPKK